MREEGCLAAHARFQPPHEVELVGEVRPPFQRFHAHRQIHRWRDGTNSFERRERVADLAGELQRQVAAQRVAGDGHCRDAIAYDQFVQHEQRIVRQPGVIQAARQMLRLAAVALVQAHDVPARRKGLLGHAAHVVRRARAFEAVQQQQRRMSRGLGLPVTVREHTCVGRHVEETRHRRGQPRKRPRLRPRIDSLDMAVQIERPVVGGFEGHTGSEVLSLTR